MSKPAMIIVVILMVAFGSVLLAADFAMGPIREDLAFARELIEALDARGWLTDDKPKPDDRVRVRTIVGGGARRLAQQEQLGIIVEVRPSLETLAAPKRLRHLAQVIAAGIDADGRSKLHWIELAILRGDRELLRTLIERDPQGGWRSPDPAIPATWTPKPRKR